ncbi:hypothetical protein DXG01_001851 [Tephrocybe rancida]|nr:hypothetical protein DXG01_001851 [Tephrocybe rancida]
MSSRMPWILLLALASRVLAQAHIAHLAPRQDPPPILDFLSLSDAQLTSCSSAAFNWVYSGPNAPLTIFISNSGVPQDASTTTGPPKTDSIGARHLQRRDDVQVTIASSISPNADGLNLTSVAVPPGRYHLIAIVATSPPYVTNSSPFTVSQGNDISCLSTTTSSLSSSPTASIPSSFTSPDTATITTSSDISSGSTSPTVLPVGGVSGTPINKGAIAGGVVAGALVLIAALMFYLFCIARPQRSRAHARAPTGANVHAAKGGFGIGTAGGENIGGRWGGLGSVDSHAPLSDPKVQRPYVSPRHPTGGAGASQDDINSYLSRSGSVALGGYAGSPSEEKFAGSPSEEMVLNTIPYRNSKSGSRPNDGRTYSGSSTTPSEYPHRPAQTQGRRPSLDTSASHGQSPFASPPTASPISVTRTPSTGTQNPRKPARKPVPSYIDSSPATSPVNTSPLALAATPFADPAPIPAILPPAPGHYSTRSERESLKSISSKKSRSKTKLRDQDSNRDWSNGSSTNASSEELSRQDLAHKNSFGPGGVEGKPLHYLIPDMPKLLKPSCSLPYNALNNVLEDTMGRHPGTGIHARQDTPLLIFVGLSDAQLTSCSSAAFDWVYSGPDAPLTIFISNVGVPQDASTTTGPPKTGSIGARHLQRRGDVQVTIASSISPKSNGLNLTSVAVPPGRYHLVAVVAISPSPYVVNSTPFTVQQGADISCLPTKTSSSSSSLTAGIPSSFTSSDTATITTSSDISSGSTSPTVLPPGAVSGTPINKGVIAGGVVAGGIILIVFLGLYLFCVVRPRRRTHSRAPPGAHIHVAKGGFGMGPADHDANIGERWGSHIPSSGPRMQNPTLSPRHPMDGVGASKHVIDSYLSRSRSVPLGGYAGPSSQEKGAGSPSEKAVPDTLPSRSPNAGSGPNNGHTSGIKATPSEYPHRSSQSPGRHRSLDTSASHEEDPFASPPRTPPIGVVRTPSTGTQNSRTLTRKPVPSYIDSSRPTSPFNTSPLVPAATPFTDPAPMSAISPVPGHYSPPGERVRGEL